MAPEKGVLVLDSSFLVALANERDVHHAAARKLQEQVERGSWKSASLHEYVFLESVTVLLARRGHDLAVRFGQALLESREVELVLASDSFAQTWETFRDEARGGLSFTDAALVALARSRAGSAIATFDEGLRRVKGVRAVPA